jgi:hypothetical protein
VTENKTPRKGFKWRKWNNILHRDIGYLIFGMTLVYAVSGIALNHMRDWNPNYIITHREVAWDGGVPADPVSEAQVRSFLEKIGENKGYKSHYSPQPGQFKIWLNGGSVLLDRSTGTGYAEHIKRRPVFFEVNWLHYNPRVLWTWFSDIYSGALILVAITGLFVLKGRKGITGRGAWLTGIGVLIPVVFLMIYL